MTDWPLFSPWALQLWLWPSTTPSSLLSLAYWSAWAMCFGPGCPYRRLFIFHIWYSPSGSVFLPPACGQLSRRRTIRLMFLLLAFMFNAMRLFVGAEVIVPNCQGNKCFFLHFEFAVLCCCFVCASHGLFEKYIQWVWGDRKYADGGTEQMLIRWIIGFQHSVPLAVRAEGAEVLVAFLREPHLDLIAYSHAGYTNFCYKYCALMIDIAHGKATDQAKQMDFQLWSQKAGGREGGVEGGMMSGLEWVN